MTKKIILGEGKNDLELIKHAIGTEVKPDKIDEFVGEDVVDGLKGKESKEIRNFYKNITHMSY